MVLYTHMVGVLVFVIVIHFYKGLFVIHSYLEMSYFYFICTQATQFTVFSNLIYKKNLTAHFREETWLSETETAYLNRAWFTTVNSYQLGFKWDYLPTSDTGSTTFVGEFLSLAWM